MHDLRSDEKQVLTENEQWSKFYDIDLPGGQEWESFFKNIVTSGEIECKRDKKAHETGNVFIEYQCRGKPSGLSITKANWWAIGIDNKNGNVETAILASVPWLKHICRKYYKTSRDVVGGDNNLSRGILLRFSDFQNKENI